MSDSTDKEAKPRKKGGAMMLIIVAVAMLVAGAGGIYGLFAAGILGGPIKVIKEDNNPKLIRKGEKDPFAPAVKEGDSDGAAKEVDGDGGSEYRTLYYSFSDDFTSNLKNSDKLVQLALAASTRRDYRVVMWLKKHELAIRSAVLVVLADTPESDVDNVEGKARLQQRLVAAINKVLTSTEGFGGIDAVYFKSFIVQ